MAKNTIPTPIIEEQGIPRVPTDRKLDTEIIDTILDEHWFNSVMMTPGDSIENDINNIYRFWSAVEMKYTDSSIGGNIGINPRPMFTPYADIPSPGRKRNRDVPSPSNVSGNYGMGRYYSEAIDDNANIIYMRFGVPQFRGLFSFLSTAIDPNQSKLANTGRVSLTIIGQIVGHVIQFMTFPRVAAYYILGKFVTTAIGKVLPPRTSTYYSLKPTMYLYWSAVNYLATDLAVNMGILPRILSSDPKESTKKSVEAQNASVAILREAFPELVTEDNYIDVFAIALRAQRIENEAIKKHYSFLESNTETGYFDHIKQFIDEPVTNDTENATFKDMIQRELKNPAVVGELTKSIKAPTKEGEEPIDDIYLERDPLDIASLSEEEQNKILASGNPISSYLNEVAANFKAQWKEGSQYLPFRVDHIDTVSESFSTSIKDNDLQMTINGKAQGSRSFKFSISGGNLSDNVLIEMAESALGYAADVVGGMLDTLTFGVSNVLSVLLGGGYLDVPKQWEDSTVELPTLNYNVKLISPYGNPISLLTNVYIPLLTLMGGILPLATGKASYTSPFLVNLEHPGRTSIPLGLMTNLSITRGASELSFNKDNRTLAIDVSFTVTDLSSIVAMPMSGGSLFGADMGLDEDNVLARYLATLGGMDIASRFYLTSVAKTNLAKNYFRLKKLTSPASYALMFGDTAIGRVARMVAPRSDILSGV